MIGLILNSSLFLPAVLLLTVFFFLVSWKPKDRQLLKKIPGPPKLPLLGNALQLSGENHKLLGVLGDWFKQYGSRLHVTIGSSSRVFLMNRHDVEKVLTSSVHITKSVDYNYLHGWIGQGLITNNNGETWFVRRKMLTPAFHFRILETFLRIFNEQSDIMVQIWDKFAANQQAFDIFPYITRCALDVICETAMGIKINAQKNAEAGDDSEYVKAIYRISEVVFRRSVSPWLNPDFIWKLTQGGKEEARCLSILHGLANKVIRERKLELSQEKLKKNGKVEEKENEDDIYTKGKKRLAFLDLLLEEQAKQDGNTSPAHALSDQDIREEVDTFMFAGHDTTTANIAWTLYCIAANPDVQAKVHAELDSIFEGEDRHINAEDLSRMKYLECCIKEALRLYPSVPFYARHLLSNLQLDSEVTVPAGTEVFVITFFLHRDPEVFPDPEAYIPERFLPENMNGRHPYAFTPFSAGPRNCIGQKFAMMEIKSTVSHILRKFNIHAMDKPEDVLINVEIILRPKNGIPLKITPRKVNSVSS